jgi:hypothetical protein
VENIERAKIKVYYDVYSDFTKSAMIKGYEVMQIGLSEVNALSLGIKGMVGAVFSKFFQTLKSPYN